MSNFVEVNGSWFRTDVSMTKKEFFEKYKNKVKYSFDCADTYSKLVKYLPKQDKRKKTEE